jgi:hypothetical protein
VGSCGERVGRRAILKAGIALGIQLSLAQESSGQEKGASQRPKEGDLLVKVGDATVTPLAPADIPVGRQADNGLAHGPNGQNCAQRFPPQSRAALAA